MIRNIIVQPQHGALIFEQNIDNYNNRLLTELGRTKSLDHFMNEYENSSFYKEYILTRLNTHAQIIILMKVFVNKWKTNIM